MLTITTTKGDHGFEAEVKVGRATYSIVAPSLPMAVAFVARKAREVDPAAGLAVSLPLAEFERLAGSKA